MSASCTRIWEVEAARDGRLDDRALESSRRHRGHCTECRMEHARLSSLGAQLNDAERPTLDELGAKRLRARILADAEKSLRSEQPEATGPVRPFRASLAVAAVLLATLGGYGALHRAGAPKQTAIRVENEGRANFERSTEGDIERVTLLDGTARFSVAHEGVGPHKLVVKVPDGEVEDIGTTFHVTVREGHTVRVAVDEGRVVVHTTKSGAHGRIVSAGEVWDAEPEETAKSAPGPSAAPSPSAAPATGSTTADIVSHQRPKTSPLPAAKTEPASAPNKAPAPAAMPSSSAGEDAAYLTVIHLLREGRRDEAKAAARKYVVLYPGGLRRKEMDVVAE